MRATRAGGHLVGMATTTRRTSRPLVTSTLLLRALAAAITLTSFGGMTIFASENLHESNAPLRPAAVASATPAPTTAPTTNRTTTARTRVRSSVTTTGTAALTRTKQS
jgi:hypothetical protein